MFDDTKKASLLKKYLFLLYTDWYYKFKLNKCFESVASRPRIWGIKHMRVSGPNIHLGENVLFFAEADQKIRLTTVKLNGHQGSIKIGNNTKIMTGARISSASSIVIGDDSLIASNAYLTDADWHDLYDRSAAPGKTAPIVLEENVWICDSAIICKGVRIGSHSIVGAGSVVTKDIPPYVIAAGNPAKPIQELDPDRINNVRDKATFTL